MAVRIGSEGDSIMTKPRGPEDHPLRVALISDTHGALHDGVAPFVAACDAAVHAGDVGAASVLSALKPRSGEVWAVLGNNDVAAKWPADELEVLRTLPEELHLDLPGGRVTVVHGHRYDAATRHAQLRRQFPGARAIVYGHSHRAVLDTNTHPWVLNPGAAGRERTYGGVSAIVLTASVDRWHVELVRFGRCNPSIVTL